MKSNIVWVAIAIALHASTALAEGDLLSADELAEAIVSMTSRVWTGPRTAAPEPAPRPEPALTLRSPTASVAVHADRGVTARVHDMAVRALTEARARLDAQGWPEPLSDGGLGGGPEFDVYLSGSLPQGAYSDGLSTWSYLDRASSFAVVSPAVPVELVEACVTEAYANALLLSADPAEANTWRRATAAWLTWELIGRFGCDDSVWDQQREPHRSMVSNAAGDGAGGALWLTFLSARHSEGSGAFVRDVWTLARQRTWEGEGLRADPDLWSAIETAVRTRGDDLLENVEELAVLRWFVGRWPGGSGPLEALDADARVPIARRMTRIPTRVASRVPLDPFGSAYVVLDAPVLESASELRAWFRGEYGVRWSFVALQLDSSGTELKRLSAPHTDVEPRAYLPIRVDPRAARLVFVVTNLSRARPDADEPSGLERGFEITVTASD